MMRSARTFLVLAALATGSCLGLGGSDEAIAWYRLSVSPRPVNGPVLPLTLSLRPFTASEALVQDGVAWASSDVECGYWSTHRWAEPVAELVRQAVQEDMEQSGLFRAVFLAENSGSADLLLTAEIHRFGERDRPDGWYAEAVVTFEVSRVKDGIVLYHRRVSSEEKCDAPLVKEVVLALGRALQRMGEQVRADIRIVATPEDDR